MSQNKNRYIAFNLPNNLKQELYDIAQWINTHYKEINFIPMEFNDIHMTMCFLGELSKNIKDNKKAKILELEEKIRNIPTINNMKFNKFDLFSVKKNLIVAHFTLPKHTIDQIIKLKQSFIIYGAPNELFYEPHITLGKIMNCNSSVNIDLSEIPLPQTNIIHNLTCVLI
jgi:2'-5' RNA ligase